MKNLLPDILPRLEHNRLAGLDAGPGSFFPYYDGYSLVNLPASICDWLGVPAFGSMALGADLLNLWSKPFRQVVFLLVDGMGLNMFQNMLLGEGQGELTSLWAEISEDAVLAPLTSIAPSTTAAALTTLWTGVSPSEHGVFAYEVWLKEYSMITNMILHAPASYSGDVGSLLKAGFDPTTFLPVPTLGPHLQKFGVRSYAFQHHSIAFSGLSKMLFPGVEIKPFRTQSDLWVSLSEEMDTHQAQRNYMYIYWGDLDEMMHRFGPGNERVTLELTAFSRQLASFLIKRKEQGRGDSLFILTADHGHNLTPRRPQLEIRNHPQLLDCLVMVPSGEARLPVVYVRSGKESAFQQYVQSVWPGLFRLIPSQQAVEQGLFGKTVYKRFTERVGDFIVIPQEDGAYWWFGSRENHLLGRHGGLSRNEMLTPFYALIL